MFEEKIEEWDVCPTQAKNFKCELTNVGRWKLEEGMVLGKWIFRLKHIGSKDAPTFADQKNFFTGLIEADKRNDNFVFENGEKRPKQVEKTIENFKSFMVEKRDDKNITE